MSNQNQNTDNITSTLIRTPPPGVITFPPPHPPIPPPPPSTNSTRTEISFFRRRLNRSNSTGGSRITTRDLSKHSKEFYTRQCVFAALQTQLYKTELNQERAKLEITLEYIKNLESEVKSVYDRDINIVNNETNVIKKNSDLKAEIILLKANNLYLETKYNNVQKKLELCKTKIEDSTLLFTEFQNVLRERDKELKEIQEKNRCVICLNSDSNILYKTCNHCCVCETCSRGLIENDDMKCPICRLAFTLGDCIKIYFS